jgi:hypothetical protein
VALKYTTQIGSLCQKIDFHKAAFELVFSLIICDLPIFSFGLFVIRGFLELYFVFIPFSQQYNQHVLVGALELYHENIVSVLFEYCLLFFDEVVHENAVPETTVN